MIDGEMTRFIREEIERQMNVLLMGTAQGSSESVEDVASMYPGLSNLTGVPVASPYGLSSAAPDGIPAVSGKRGAHFGNRIVLSHLDKARPKAIPGEAVLYDQFGRTIELRKGGMLVSNPTGTFAVESNGKELMEVMIRLLTTIINARTNTIFGPQPLIPNPAGVVTGETFVKIKQDLTTMKGS